MTNIKVSLYKGGIGKQAALVVIGDAINFASGILLSMILARVISVDSMGTIRQLMYLMPMVVSLVESGLSSTVYRFWNAFDHFQKICYARMIVVCSFLLGIISSFIILAMAPYLPVWYNNPDLKIALIIIAPYPLSTIPLMLLRPILLSKGYSLYATSLEMVFSIINVLSLVIPLWMEVSLMTALFIWIIFSLLRLVAIPFILKEYLNLTGVWWNKKIQRQVIEYLWPLQIARIPGFIVGYLDKVVMSLFLTTQGFAIYSMGAREIPFIGTVGSSVAGVLIPNLVEDVEDKKYEQIMRRWRIACERTAIATYLFAAFCIWHAVPVMQFMYSATYSDSSIPFRVFCALTFIRVIEYASIAKAFGRSDFIMKSSFVCAVSMIVLSIPLTYAMGIFGMAMVIFLGTAFSAIYYLFLYKKLLNKQISSFFPWPRLILLFLISLSSIAIVTVLIGNSISLSNNSTIVYLGLKLCLLFVISACIYFILLIIFGFIKINYLINIDKMFKLINKKVHL